MANPRLCVSATLLGLLHVLGLLLFPCPRVYAITLVLAVATSVWNHGTTSECAKWSDRLTIAWATVVTTGYVVYVLPDTHPLRDEMLSTMSAGILAYFGAKHLLQRHRDGTTGRASVSTPSHPWWCDAPHVCAHVTQTLCNLAIIHALSNPLHCRDVWLDGMLCVV